MTCSVCNTEFADRTIPIGDSRIQLNLCECRAEKLSAKYRNTRFEDKQEPSPELRKVVVP